jgi:outer membrane receptor protein involved in Fe transport
MRALEPARAARAARATRATLTVALATAPRGARADDGPGLPVRELPPLPDISTEPDTSSDVSMYGAALAEEETVVGASKREQSLGTAASAVTVLTADTLRRYGYRTLADALRGVGGLYVVDDRMIERVGVRGVQLLGDANTRILILIDGAPINEPWSQFVDAGAALPVALDDVARIEIIRGPVSSIYGTNAFLGIINIVTLDVDRAPRAWGRATAGTTGTLGSHAGFALGDLDRQIRGTASYQHRLGETLVYPDLPAGGAETSADGAHAILGSLAVTVDRVFFQARAAQRQRELPGAPYDGAFGSDDNTHRDRHLLAEVGYSHEVSRRLTLAARAYANRYAFTGRLDDGAGGFRTDATSTWYGGELRALADVLATPEQLTLTAGVAVERTHASSTSTDRPDALATDLTIAGLYLDAAARPWPWLGVSLGARYDRNSQFEAELSPRAALFLHPGDAWGLKLLYAQGFRNPSIFEAYHDDGRRFSPELDDATGESTLASESILAYELVAYGRLTDGLRVRGSLWEWRMDELMRRTQAFVPPPVNDLRLRFQNGGPLVSRGVEVEASFRDVDGRSAYGAAAVALTGRNCLGDDGLGNLWLDPDAGNCDPRQNAPVVVAQLGASSHLLFDAFHASAEAQLVSARGTQDARASVPAHVGLHVVAYAPDVRGFDVTVGVRNLLGRERVPAQSEYNRTSPDALTVLEVPGPGRELFVRVGRRL